MARLKQMSDLHASLPTSDGKDLLAEQIRDEVVSLVRFQRLAEQRARSRRWAVIVVIGSVQVVTLAGVAVWAFVTELSAAESEGLLSIGAAALGALVAASAALVSSFSARRALQEADEAAASVYEARRRTQQSRQEPEE